MKKVLVIVVMLGTLLVSVGCGKKSESDEAKAAVTGYLDAIIKSDYKKAASFLEDSSEFTTDEVDPITSELFSKISYEIQEVNKEDDKATVKLKVKHPDFLKIITAAQTKLVESLQQSFDAGLDATDTDANAEEMTEIVENIIKESMGEEDEEFMESEGEFIVKKIDGKWKITKESNVGSIFGLE